ncbi:MAG: ABC transporter permease, partial [Bacteroidota bacterium]
LWLNIAWVAVMIIAAAMAITGRAGIKYRYLAPALGLSILVNVVVNGLIYIFLIVGWPDFLDARYIIPIMGMVIGNTLGATVIGIRSFFNGLSKDSNVYQYYLMCGATKGEALFRFMSKAMQDAFSPNIASTATIGLIWLPGMMTGQILGGASPVTAIKYQIMIIISIFVGGVITVWLSLLISKRFVFDDYDLFDQGIFRGQKAKKAHTAKS